MQSKRLVKLGLVHAAAQVAGERGTPCCQAGWRSCCNVLPGCCGCGATLQDQPGAARAPRPCPARLSASLERRRPGGGALEAESGCGLVAEGFLLEYISRITPSTCSDGGWRMWWAGQLGSMAWVDQAIVARRLQLKPLSCITAGTAPAHVQPANPPTSSSSLYAFQSAFLI